MAWAGNISSKIPARSQAGQLCELPSVAGGAIVGGAVPSTANRPLVATGATAWTELGFALPANLSGAAAGQPIEAASTTALQLGTAYKKCVQRLKDIGDLGGNQTIDNTTHVETEIQVSITPKNANNILRIVACGRVFSSTPDATSAERRCSAAISLNTTAGEAGAHNGTLVKSSMQGDQLVLTSTLITNNTGEFVLIYDVVAGSTTTRTYTLCVGNVAADVPVVFVNSGTALPLMTIDEWEP